MQRNATASEFVHKGLAFGAPFFQVGWRVFGFGGPGENKIGDLQIADRAGEVRGFAVQFAAEQKRSLAGFVRGAGIAEDRRERAPLVDHDRVITDLWNERPRVVTHDEARKHDEGIDR